ncbi:flagellar assembly protein FliW [Bacillus sp. S/N-304-OC-R1]|uniref:flagellar assembly protein FliW n=1 Tax=Bacillus sp. S/N-304-OC-R1 TaxID=2758034 RepID=UPI001C8D5E82|nr:flagellar assembly protein FliW [Bacillus sp. S/N-304-OC-R1]MBY0123466.1 flagellar assembly protein FliW [Bacillus sp. S/N-304-OC-R1]
MKIQSKYHGEIKIEKSKVIHFPQGIPSFLEEKEFYILPFADEGPFFIMQSVLTPSLAFVIVSPFDFFKDYEVKLTDQVINSLDISNQENVVVFVILTIQEPFQNTTANLQGPIVINDAKKIGKQVILSDSPYKTKHLLLSQLSSAGKEG